MSKFKNSILKKLFIAQSVLILIPLTISFISSYSYNQNQYSTQMINLASDRLRQIDIDISNKIDVCIQNAKLFANSLSVSRMLSQKKISDYAMVSMINEDLLPFIETVESQNVYASSIRIIHGNKEIFDVHDHLYYDSNYLENVYKIFSKANYNTSESLYQQIAILEPQVKPAYSKTYGLSNEKHFLLYTPIYNSFLNKIVGIVEIAISPDDIFSSINELDGAIYDNVKVLYNSDKLIYNRTFSEKAHYGNAEVLTQRLSGINSSLEISVFFKPIQQFNLIISFLSAFVVLCLLSFITVHFMLKRLVSLNFTIKKIKTGDLTHRVFVKGNDEISELSINFNDMVEKINSLLQKLEISNQLEKEAIYKSLENQLNPHFLINSLEMLKMLAISHGEKDIAKNIDMISTFYSYNLRNHNKSVLLGEELANIKSYIGIYSRLKNNFIKYNIFIDDPDILEKCYILKFTLQPIIENAVKHGFRQKSEHCLINIYLRLEQDCLIIEIEDNGDGISDADFKQLQESLDFGRIEAGGLDGYSGIGLNNIQSRICTNYGTAYGINIQNEVGVGFLVTLKLPIITYPDL